ncbi:hypothetical protein T12_15345 [Trichinella patagoniensis]|uniref:Uncharacterized protein n=1 Tax=Trichinella patagoniensis TaxID=990121 RepID=A0A0V1AA01_9BILA|nr:hypothetical protein T12_15345 [Trichinella patagoniensis]
MSTIPFDNKFTLFNEKYLFSMQFQLKATLNKNVYLINQMINNGSATIPILIIRFSSFFPSYINCSEINIKTVISIFLGKNSTNIEDVLFCLLLELEIILQSQ